MKLALGSVQFGLDYGIANRGGIVSDADLRNILAIARGSGVDTIDSAVLYGSSEQRLGNAGVQDFQIITKLPEFPGGTDVGKWVEGQVTDSLQRLQKERLYGLMLHRPAQLFSPVGAELYQAMVKVRGKGLVKKIGYSIYSPAELDTLFLTHQPDIVQAPMNIIDRRIQTSGWLRKLHNNNVEVHARSCFLQGLLLMPPAERPRQFMRFNQLWQRMESWLAAENLNPLSACLQFMYGVPEVDKVVVGVNSPDQFREILAVGCDNRIYFPEELSSEDPELIDPSLWTRQ